MYNIRLLYCAREIIMRNRAREIERERREGRSILADNAIPATEHERAACVRSMRHRAGEIMKSAQAIEQAER